MNEWEIYAAAMEIEDSQQRDEFLDNVCVDDQALRERVELLLANSHSEDSFLESPPTGLVLDSTAELQIGERVGDRVGPFKLLQQIGEGGMGVVFMAEQKKPVKRRVALKIIKPGMDSRQVVARFEAERQALAMMDHPNIARAIDVGTTSSGRPYFVMELVKGIPITKYCDEHKLTPRQRMELFIPVCGAIQHAHQKGIIHRDIKPSNILVAEYDNQAVPKIIDFGVAKALNQTLTEKTVFTQLGQVIGTLEYMSPEQAKVNQLDVDTRSDIYSLGVLLYELLTGNTPFDRERLRSVAWDELVRIIREEEPPRMSLRLSTSETLPSIAATRQTDPGKLSTLVRGELDWIVMKALDKERNRRYETANGLALDIQRYLHDEPVSACPPSTAYRFKKFARRNKVAMATGGLVAATLLIGLSGTTWQMFRARAAERLAEARLTEANEARDQEAKQRQEAERQQQLAEQQRLLAESEKTRADQEAGKAVEQAALAEKERAIAEAVNRFLQEDLLGMADAGLQLENEIEPDPDVKLRTLLERAAKIIDVRFEDQPDLRAEVQATLGHAYRAIGRYEEALKLHQTVHAYHEEVHGLEHPSRITSLANLAIAYGDVGQYEESVALFEEALTLWQNAYGLDHIDTLIAMNNLAVAYSKVGRYDESLALQEETLERRTIVLGPDHPDTLCSMFHVAVGHRVLGNYDKALPLLEQAVQGHKETFGADHPDTLNCMNSLAVAFRVVGNLDQAVELHTETLKLQKRTLGADHPQAILSMMCLANALRKQGEYEKSLELHDETFTLAKAKLGLDHPQTLRCMGHLAMAYAHAGQYDKAVPLCEEAFELKKTKWGSDHPDTLESMGGLGMIYRLLKQSEKAVPLFEEELKLRLAKYGQDHPDTLRTMNDLATAYTDTGRNVEALPLLEKCLEGQRAKLGPGHPKTLIMMNNLATAYYVAGQFEKAIALEEDTLTLAKANLGLDHPNTLGYMSNLAVYLGKVGKSEEALSLFEETFKLSQAKLGHDHPLTIQRMFGLAYSYRDVGQLDKAIALSKEAIAIARGKFSSDSPQLASRLASYGSYCLEAKRYSEAEAVLRECLAIREQAMPDLWLLFNSYSMLGAALLGQQKHEEAEPLLLKGYQGMKDRESSIPPNANFRLNEGLQRLVELYQAMDKQEEAARWQAELDRRKGA